MRDVCAVALCRGLGFVWLVWGLASLVLLGTRDLGAVVVVAPCPFSGVLAKVDMVVPGPIFIMVWMSMLVRPEASCACVCVCIMFR